MDYVGGRLSSLAVVGGVVLAFLAARLVESAGLPGPVAVGAGLVAFAATLVAVDAAGGRPIRQPGNGRQ
jgi:hypothetical protein